MRGIYSRWIRWFEWIEVFAWVEVGQRDSSRGRLVGTVECHRVFGDVKEYQSGALRSLVVSYRKNSISEPRAGRHI